MDSPTPPPKSANKHHQPQQAKPSSRSGSPQVKQRHHTQRGYQSGSETASPAHSKQASRTSSPRRRTRTPNNRNNTRNVRSGSHATQGYVSDREAAAQLSSSGQVNESDHNNNSHKGGRSHRKTKSSHTAPTQNHVSSLDGATTNTPAKEAAYAGPTFHASPAPSALPIPKFFAKTAPSAPANGTQSSMQARLDAEEQAANSDHAVSDGGPVRREESPLDILFNAHRAEKAKQSNSWVTPPPTGSQAQKVAPSDGSVPRQSPSMLSTSKQAFMMELDGVQDYDSEEATQAGQGTTSFKDRINSIKGPPVQQQQQQQQLPSFDEEQRKFKSQALKNLLMHQQDLSPQRQDYRSSSLPGHAGTPQKFEGGQRHSSHQSASPINSGRPHTRAMDARHSSQSPQQAAGISPAPAQPLPPAPAPAPAPAHYSPGGGNNLALSEPPAQRPAADVKSMESDLRRILKLDGP